MQVISKPLSVAWARQHEQQHEQAKGEKKVRGRLVKVYTCVLIPLNKMEVFDWLDRIQHQAAYFCLFNLSYNRNNGFSSNEFESKMTKESNRLSLRMHNIIRYCTPDASHLVDLVSSNASYVTLKPWR